MCPEGRSVQARVSTTRGDAPRHKAAGGPTAARGSKPMTRLNALFAALRAVVAAMVEGDLAMLWLAPELALRRGDAAPPPSLPGIRHVPSVPVVHLLEERF